ncbi:mannose-1-phosphate guanylyltransferase/mannose-6-phosphate isomerase [Methylorubrum extorquens]|uniref:mannose-1-phosphate guanylyltransferase/mannose-6-phosphate isomerase n=1 Tax=Methylorubrum extorquens TaxID=408 RepID=UPI000158FC58|nr:mannose-1-phosphate guanylyltransferase/mannose-6-phosphate isomerase [Methylorubrum extorquens]ABY33161.1 mannose-1-phosphate guanylyltransferase/mannose-6-phosphate isomerase [Methylorubrum extorquens PA1]KQP86378.1 mannose-1-phosphate guanyltransferase [Methylobacterium sp. Leaf119]WIU39737.1 mannose-1-phosphate guanylyltransferase/mannose-6-phosphate isomerase [Methylorubrum extorquens]
MAEADHEKILPVILCGGSGTRLWPASRESMPKQFTPLVDPASSTFQATVRRVADEAVFARPTVIASAESRFIVAEQLAQAGIAADILLEPERRDSAAAVAVAALHGARRGPETVVLVMAADHVIEDATAFASAAQEAALGARLGQIMTLGITPTRPATEYGYIRTGGALPDAPGLHRVERFVEKPDAAGAERLIGEGALWNSGYFLFRADVMIAELEAHAPEVLEAARGALANAATDLDFVRLQAESFARAPKTSIDYAVMERTTRAGVLAVSFAWSDVGTWDAVWQVLERDAQGNAVRGRVELVETTGSLVHSEGDGLTTVVGLDDVVVVATPDAVLVASKAKSGKVKDLVTVLREKAHPEADAHRRMYRPWGWYQRIDIGERFQVKRIMVTPGGRLSLQKHFHRAEHWVVVKGTAEVTLNDSIVLVHENEAVYLPIGSMHRLTNPGKIPLELIEVQVGSYTGEDDIIRVEDVYGR